MNQRERDKEPATCSSRCQWILTSTLESDVAVPIRSRGERQDGPFVQARSPVTAGLRWLCFLVDEELAGAVRPG